jgi:hypothetical protein
MSSLTCSEFDSLLFERTAECNDADARLSDHAASCRRCAAVWTEERALDAAISAWKAGVPETDLTGRVLARWRGERTLVTSPESPSNPRRERSPARGRQHFALLAIAAAAALMLAVSLVSQNPRPIPRGGVAKLPDAGAAGPEPRDFPKSLGSASVELPVDQLVTGMRTRYTGAANRVTQFVDGWKFELPAVAEVDVNLLPQNGAATAPKPGPKPETSGGLGETLKPIGRDVGKAFSFLRDAIPVLDGSSI